MASSLDRPVLDKDDVLGDLFDSRGVGVDLDDVIGFIRRHEKAI